jgi:DNA polymerase II large subunit
MPEKENKNLKEELAIIAEPHIQRYYDSIFKRVNSQIDSARKAKASGKDIETEISTKPALDLADRTESIIGPKGIAERYRLVLKEKNGDRIKAIFQIFQEIIEQKWVFIPDDQKRLEQAIRTALVLITEGVVVAPLDGVPRILISENPDGSKYVDIYYAGPIRAAGGTATVFPLILGDFARKLMQLDRYKPTNDEIERYVEETQIYDEIISRQYKLKPEEVQKIVQGCPVCINGEPTEEREVVAYRDLPRIPTNRVRGGMCLVISEGIALKAMKILSYAKILDLDWHWLEEVIKVSKKATKDLKITPNQKFLEGIAAGRPIFAYPSRIGGFRLRYGRTRNTGIMGKAIHPATMYTLDEFIAVGTQMKVERPGKAAGMFPCDSIEGPIVKLSNESIVKVKTPEEAIRLKPQIEKILFLGDLLVSIGDFRKTAHPLVPVGYNEEWWNLELKKALGEKQKTKLQEKILSREQLPSVEEAIAISKEYKIPLHPQFLNYYLALSKEETINLAKKVSTAETKKENNKIVSLSIENSEETKKALEKIGLQHSLSDGKKIF